MAGLVRQVPAGCVGGVRQPGIGRATGRRGWRVPVQGLRNSRRRRRGWDRPPCRLRDLGDRWGGRRSGFLVRPCNLGRLPRRPIGLCNGSGRRWVRRSAHLAGSQPGRGRRRRHGCTLPASLGNRRRLSGSRCTIRWRHWLCQLRRQRCRRGRLHGCRDRGRRLKRHGLLLCFCDRCAGRKRRGLPRAHCLG
jgi:hypothetical protein